MNAAPPPDRIFAAEFAALAQAAYDTWHTKIGLDGPDSPATWETLPPDMRDVWAAVVHRVLIGAWCLPCLRIIWSYPRDGIRAEAYSTAGRWYWSEQSLDGLKSWLASVPADAEPVRFSTYSGDHVGLWASTIDAVTDEPVCLHHAQWFAAQRTLGLR